jgi:hypothetical protein
LDLGAASAAAAQKNKTGDLKPASAQASEGQGSGASAASAKSGQQGSAEYGLMNSRLLSGSRHSGFGMATYVGDREWKWNGDICERISKKCRETWDGRLDADGCASGHGTFSQYQNDILFWRYNGNCLRDKFHGHGVLLKYSKSGILQYDYVGNFLKDKFSGRGTCQIYGAGVSVLEVYEGEWKASKRHGHGKCHYDDGSHHDGIWVNHRIFGRGTRTYPSDSPTGFSTRTGFFMSLLYSKKKSNIYCDVIEEDGKKRCIVLHGKDGQIHFSSGVKAEGEFRRDSLNGRGAYYYENGMKYIGKFLNDEASGRGAVTFLDGSVFYGIFKKDCPVQGTLTIDGLRYAVKYNGITEIAEVK